jgi:DNA polymerase-3 subunit delta
LKKADASRSDAPPAVKERITLLIGKNAPARMDRLRQLKADWLDEDWIDFNYSEIDAREARPNDLLMMLGQVAIGDPEKRRILVVRGIDQIRASDAESLAEILPKVPSEARLIFVGEGDKIGREAKLSAKFLKAVEKEGRVFDFPTLRSVEVAGFIQMRAKERGIRLSNDAPRVLAARVGNDAAVLDQELSKLASAVQPNEIVTGSLIAELTPASVEHTVFELTDAVGERNAPKAIDALQSLLASGQSIYMLLPMISRQLRLVWQMKAELEGDGDAGLKDPSISRLGDWQKRKLQQQAQTFDWRALERGLSSLFEADLTLKGVEEGGEDPQALLETLILRLCGGDRFVIPLH